MKIDDTWISKLPFYYLHNYLIALTVADQYRLNMNAFINMSSVLHSIKQIDGIENNNTGCFII